MTSRDYASARVSYDAGSLLESDLAAHPLGQFERWYDDACAVGLAEPSAMVVATVDAEGSPSLRTVLLKDLGSRGFTFFTSLTSRKGTDLQARPVASALFGWHAMHRQVTIRGTVEPVPRQIAATYFASRPRGSQLSAILSRQSAPVVSREELDKRWERLAALHPDEDAPLALPDHWGGFTIRPTEIEFWHGRASRLHDRLVYLPVAEGDAPPLDVAGDWRVQRREP